MIDAGSIMNHCGNKDHINFSGSKKRGNQVKLYEGGFSFADK